eukprot:TRINITY_DN22445_c0_g1_i1.p1 TRINITY_DN22445_c0_g1~~TRINITY_DN22445_c0_g1_i1.p1  ORF type:complete len:152 (-),score=18.78 TRINITY_DN22445_c0_g1_i1:33-488(-)
MSGKTAFDKQKDKEGKGIDLEKVVALADVPLSMMSEERFSLRLPSRTEVESPRLPTLTQLQEHRRIFSRIEESPTQHYNYFVSKTRILVTIILFLLGSICSSMVFYFMSISKQREAIGFAVLSIISCLPSLFNIIKTVSYTHLTLPTIYSV